MDTPIPFDWESTPIELKTNAARDSGKSLGVVFKAEGSAYAVYLTVTFNSAPTYKIGGCLNIEKGFDKALPTGGEMIWRFTKTRTKDGKIIVQMHCNDEEMVNVELSDTVCPYKSVFGMTWRDRWLLKPDTMKFIGDFTAIEVYRAYKTGEILTMCLSIL